MKIKITITVFVTLVLVIVGNYYYQQENSKESQYTRTHANESISFTKPEGFFVTDYTDSFSILSLAVSPKYSGFDCFDTYEQLISIRASVPGSLTYGVSPEAYKKNNGIKVDPEIVTYGPNTFYIFNERYYLFTSTTMLEIRYRPSNCAWKDTDYSKEFSQILSTLDFKEDKTLYVKTEVEIAQEKIEKLKSFLQRDYENGKYTSSENCNYFAANDRNEYDFRMNICLEFFSSKEVSAIEKIESISKSTEPVFDEDVANNLCELVPQVSDHYGAWGGTFYYSDENNFCNDPDVLRYENEFKKMGYEMSCASTDKSFVVSISNGTDGYCFDTKNTNIVKSSGIKQQDNIGVCSVVDLKTDYQCKNFPNI